MQKLLGSTQALPASFSDQVAAAATDLDQKHAAVLAALGACDAQLRAYVDEARQPADI